MIKQILILMVLITSFTFLGIGQPSNKTNAADTLHFMPQQLSSTNYISPLSEREVLLSISVLVFGLILAIFAGTIALKRGWGQDATRIFAVSVIVSAGLFLITAGYSDSQMSPMFGLLGTLVGYLLGKNHPDDVAKK